MVILLRKFFDWLFTDVDGRAQTKHLEGHAISAYRACIRAVDDFVDTDAAEESGRYFKAKLQYADTDILRLASVAQRMCQFLNSYAKHCLGLPTATCEEMDLFAFAYAAQGWLRQVHTHHGFYKWYGQLRVSSDGSNKAMLGLLESAEAPSGGSSKKSSLSIQALIAHELLSHPSCSGKVSTKQARDMVKDKARLTKENDLAKKTKETLDMLSGKGVIEFLEYDTLEKLCLQVILEVMNFKEVSIDI